MKKMTIAGLGAGDLDQLPLGIYKLLKSGIPVYLRTKEHPVINSLEQEGLKYESFDSKEKMMRKFVKLY